MTRRIAALALAAALAGCEEPDRPPIVDHDGVVAVAGSVSVQGGGPAAGSVISVRVCSRLTSVEWMRADTVTDVAGRFLVTIRGAPVSDTVLVRVTAEPPPGSGLAAKSDSVLTRLWIDTARDTVRFNLVFGG